MVIMESEMSELKKMVSGQVYDPSDAKLSQMRANVRDITAKYNVKNREQKTERDELLKGLFGRTGNCIKIEPNFDYAHNIIVGENF